MSCIHKFININDYVGLVPSWDYNKLIIGTFNPSNDFHSKNSANFFYQRSKNYFWDVLPKFYNDSIKKDDINSQINFLKKNKIGITDILISINDANVNDKSHVELISTVLDKDIEKFNSFTWNTENILAELDKGRIKYVYFTKLGNNNARVSENSFENQFRIVEKYCSENKIYSYRLHTPSGMGLGRGKRVDTLYKKWSSFFKK